MVYFIDNDKKLTELKSTVAELHNEKLIGLDTETTGLDPFIDKVIMVQFGTMKNQFVLDVRKLDAGLLADIVFPLFTSNTLRKILHNAAFDYKMFKTNYGIVVENMYDTMVLDQLATRGILNKGKGVFSLEGSLKRRLGLEISKKEQTSFINMPKDLAFTKEQIQYGANDVIYPLKLIRVLADEIKTKQLTESARLEMDVLPVIAESELYGWGFDVEGWKKAYADAVVEFEKRKEELQKFIKDNKCYGWGINRTPQTDLFSAKQGSEEEVAINLNSNAQLRKVFRNVGLLALSEKDKDLLPIIIEGVKIGLAAPNKLQSYFNALLTNNEKALTTIKVPKKKVDEVEIEQGELYLATRKPKNYKVVNKTNVKFVIECIDDFVKFGKEPELALEGLGAPELKPYTYLTDDTDYEEVTISEKPLNENLLFLIKHYLEFKNYEKKLSSFGLEYINKNVHPVTGRVHPRYWQLGTTTSRFSSSEPNMQQIPREAQYRHCFIAKPGHKIITADYSGCELRILAEFSQDPVFIEIFNSGGDLHSQVASMMFNTEVSKKVNPHLRQAAKAINFGLAYSMGAQGLHRRLLLEGMLDVTPEYAQELIDKYFTTFPQIHEYLEEAGARAQKKGFCHMLPPSDFKVYFPYTSKWFQELEQLNELCYNTPDLKEEEREKYLVRRAEVKANIASVKRKGKNYPIQGTNARILKYALVGIARKIKETALPMYIIGNVHDEVVCEVEETYVEEGVAVQVGTMKSVGEMFVKCVPMEVDYQVGDTWSK